MSTTPKLQQLYTDSTVSETNVSEKPLQDEIVYFNDDAADSSGKSRKLIPSISRKFCRFKRFVLEVFFFQRKRFEWRSTDNKNDAQYRSRKFKDVNDEDGDQLSQVSSSSSSSSSDSETKLWGGTSSSDLSTDFYSGEFLITFLLIV